MPQPASALSPQSDPINSKTASVVHPREWMPCPSCPLCTRAPKTRHFTSYKQATHHELRTGMPCALALTIAPASLLDGFMELPCVSCSPPTKISGTSHLSCPMRDVCAISG